MAVVETSDVVVVGGGACGSTTAYFLREEGLKVTLVDRVKVGQEASWASAGMIGPTASPQGDPWFLKVTALSKIIYDDLNERLYTETGRRIGYGGEGSLSIALSDAEIEQTKMEVEVQEGSGVAAELLTGEEAVKREPALSQEVVSAAFFPEGRFLDARDFTATIALSGQATGVSVYEGWPVTGMVWDGERVIGVRSGADEIHAGIVVNAAGAWAGKLDSKLPHPRLPDSRADHVRLRPPLRVASQRLEDERVGLRDPQVRRTGGGGSHPGRLGLPETDHTRRYGRIERDRPERSSQSFRTTHPGRLDGFETCHTRRVANRRTRSTSKRGLSVGGRARGVRYETGAWNRDGPDRSRDGPEAQYTDRTGADRAILVKQVTSQSKLRTDFNARGVFVFVMTPFKINEGSIRKVPDRPPRSRGEYPPLFPHKRREGHGHMRRIG